MSNPHELYEQLCNDLNVKSDVKVLRALIDICKTGELNVAGLSLTVQTCEMLSKLLPQSRDIVKLNLGDCLVPPQGLAAMFAIMHLSHIFSLQLRGNNIAGPSVFKLGKMLSRSTNIKILGLEWNNLGLCSEGMTQFCNALGTNHSLEVLDLRNNQLDEGCAALLAAALRKNITLKVLDVRWNTIEQTGGQYFLSALQTNKTLTSLKLQGNAISNDLLIAIEQCVQHNLSLLRLESGYEAQKELLTNHARTLATKQAHEIQLLANKHKKQLGEMDAQIRELEGLLVSKQLHLEKVQKEIIEKSKELEVAQNHIENLRQEIKLQDENHKATVRDYQLQMDILNKALSSNKSILSNLEAQVEEDKKLREIVEEERNKDREQIRSLELEVKKGKEELQKTVTDHIVAVEQERNQAHQRLILLEQDWNLRQEQKVAEHCRAEQVYRDKIRALESALEIAERNSAEQHSQWSVERTKWAEEKANILADAREKESCKVLLLVEKIDHLKEEKVSLENQLALANSSCQKLQGDNSNIMADLTDSRRKLSALHEELSNERLTSQKLRSESAENQRVLEATKLALTSSEGREREIQLSIETLKREIQRFSERLEEKDRIIACVRNEEKERASVLVAAIKKYLDQINYTT